jgi:hypothetical protein
MAFCSTGIDLAKWKAQKHIEGAYGFNAGGTHFLVRHLVNFRVVTPELFSMLGIYRTNFRNTGREIDHAVDFERCRRGEIAVG